MDFRHSSHICLGLSFSLICVLGFQVMQIHPKQGILHPGDTAVCFLTFTASDYPTDYQLDVICQVTQHWVYFDCPFTLAS